MEQLYPIQEFELDQNNSIVFLVLGTTLFCYITYWFFIHSTIFKKLCNTYLKKETLSFYRIVIGRYFGFLMLGVIPLSLLYVVGKFSLASLGIQFSAAQASFNIAASLILGILAISINWSRRKNENNLLAYPQIRIKNWDVSLVLKNSISWGFYLLGYEILFRGVLLFPLVPVFGLYPAIAINTIIYSLVHIPKGLGETLGSILLGIVLCLLTLKTGSIFIAFMAHLFLAISNFLFTLHQHRKMNFSKI